MVVALACYKGINTTGGTEGVGQSTTMTVVIGSMIIFISNYFLTKLMLVI
jgi:phospholipid/cholesterol/gamma-HCH transport system permease protein